MVYAHFVFFFNSSHIAWDPGLFGISESEAERVDPQQRHVLECVHMAMEDGGITRKQIGGSKTGVFIGMLSFLDCINLSH